MIVVKRIRFAAWLLEKLLACNSCLLVVFLVKDQKRDSIVVFLFLGIGGAVLRLVLVLLICFFGPLGGGKLFIGDNDNGYLTLYC